MVRVRYAEATGEAEVSGTRAGLLALAGVLRSGSGGLPLAPMTDPAPYDRVLAQLSVRLRETGKVRISADPDDGALVIEGGPDALAVLAGNIEDFATEADSCHHLHVEYFPGHHYLAEGPAPVVVTFSGTPSEP